MDPVTTAAVSAVGTVLGGVSSLASATKKAPKAEPLPEAPKPTVMPMPDDDAAQRARRSRLAQVQQRSGRMSTMLSDSNGEKLGA